MDSEIMRTIGVLAVALVNAMPDESYCAAVETFNRYANDKEHTQDMRTLFWTISHVLTAPTALLKAEIEETDRHEPRKRQFAVINGGNAA